MAAPNQGLEVEEIHSLLNSIIGRLARLHGEQKGEIENDLRLLQSCVDDLLEENAQDKQIIAGLLESRPAKAAELEHQKRLEQLNDLLDSAAEPIFVLDNDWNYIFANRNHHKNLNKEPGYLIGKNFWEVNPEVIGSQVEYHLRKARAEGKPSHERLMGVYVPVWYDFSVYPTPYGVSVFSYDMTEQVKAEEELRRLEEQNIEAETNLEVQHRLVEQREQERQMIARDIHDGPIQSLVSTMFNIQLTKEALRDPQMQVELNQIGLSIKHTIQELRHVVNELRPPAVLHVGLARMIRMHCTDFEEKHPEIVVDHELVDDRGKLAENTCLTLYRIYQEAINNIARHASATRIQVRFSISEDQAVLQIEDNGKGFPGSPDLISQTAKGHYGMAGMKERAEAAGGEIQIHSTPGSGTTILVKVPVEKT